ncbi:MAG TPA: ribosome-associated translation inhibitor RaiA [Candidatus Dojkabacteria bacterium]|nr:ribosome-associated translation inhibitor RaiA [Candidatus Dojkabacteria bacterium]
MQIEEIKFTFNGMEPSDAIKKYFIEKMTKFETFLRKVNSCDVNFIDYSSNRGTQTDFKIDINVKVPNSFVHVDETGDNMYAIIDTATDILGRRIKRYFDKLNQWEGTNPWTVSDDPITAEEIAESSEVDNYSDYVPKIAKRSKMQEMRPLEEAEAIELMELSGKNQLLFKSSKTSKISMIYKMSNGLYGLVEPDDEI